MYGSNVLGSSNNKYLKVMLSIILGDPLVYRLISMDDLYVMIILATGIWLI